MTFSIQDFLCSEALRVVTLKSTICERYYESQYMRFLKSARLSEFHFKTLVVFPTSFVADAVKISGYNFEGPLRLNQKNG